MGINASKDAGDDFESIPVRNQTSASGKNQRTTVPSALVSPPQTPRDAQNMPGYTSPRQTQATTTTQSLPMVPSRSSGMAAPSTEGDDLIPMVFKWEHGGKNVFIGGSFNNWERNIPMHKSGNDFSYIHNVKRGKHAFKFLVDDDWRFAPDQPTVSDVEGRISNFVDVSDFTPYTGDDHYFDKSKEQKLPEHEFKQLVPDLDEYSKEPPSLPPHLRHIILNKPSPSIDQLALSSPQHVSLNHLYCTAIKDGMMVLGSTHRYKEKYCTIVFYAMMPAPSG